MRSTASPSLFCIMILMLAVTRESDTISRQEYVVLGGTMTWHEAWEKCVAAGFILAPAAHKSFNLQEVKKLLLKDGVHKRLWIDGMRSSRVCSCQWELTDDHHREAMVQEDSRMAKNECLTVTAPDIIGFADCSHYQAGALCSVPVRRVADKRSSTIQGNSTSPNKFKLVEAKIFWFPIVFAALIVSLLIILTLLVVILVQRTVSCKKKHHVQPILVDSKSTSLMYDDVNTIDTDTVDQQHRSDCKNSYSTKQKPESGGEHMHVKVGGTLTNTGKLKFGSNSKICTLSTTSESCGRKKEAHLRPGHQFINRQVIQNLQTQLDEGPCEMTSLYDSLVSSKCGERAVTETTTDPREGK